MTHHQLINKLKTRMEILSFSEEDVALKSGVSEHTVSRLLSGYNVRMTSLFAVAESLNYKLNIKLANKGEE